MKFFMITNYKSIYNAEAIDWNATNMNDKERSKLNSSNSAT